MWSYFCFTLPFIFGIKVFIQLRALILQWFSLFSKGFSLIGIKQKCFLCEQEEVVNLSVCNPCCKSLPWWDKSKVCFRCALPLEYQQGSLFCGRCQKEPPYYHRTIAAFYYVPPLQAVIKSFKFRQAFYCGQFLAKALLQTVKHSYELDEWPEVLIPVPLHDLRLKERGFNQSLEIAKKCGRRLNIPIDKESYMQKLSSTPQSTLNITGRKQKRQSFAATPFLKQYRHVAIIDDVMTTGMTVNHLAQILRESGVERVDVWVCARTRYSLN